MYTDRYRIMLAGPSLLYAPIYLARVEQLSYAFKWIDIDYPTRIDAKAKRDPVFFRLLDDQGDHDIILAVADPFRLRYTASTGHKPDCAAVIGGLVQRTCLWMIDKSCAFDHTNDSHRISKFFSQIVVHRPEMTSYALLSALLLKELERDNLEMNSEAKIAKVRGMLFHSVRLAEEHRWAHRRIATTTRPIAYVTVDQNHALPDDTEYIRFYQYGDEDTRHLLFTGLITRASLWSEEGISSKRPFLEETKQGIARAVALIHEDPHWAAQCLAKDQELMKRLPGRQTVALIENYLRTLISIQAYVLDDALKVPYDLYERGFDLHKKSDLVRSVVQDLQTDDNDLKRSFENVIIADSGEIASPSRRAAYTLRDEGRRSFVGRLLSTLANGLVATGIGVRPTRRYSTSCRREVAWQIPSRPRRTYNLPPPRPIPLRSSYSPLGTLLGIIAFAMALLFATDTFLAALRSRLLPCAALHWHIELSRRLYHFISVHCLLPIWLPTWPLSTIFDCIAKGVVVLIGLIAVRLLLPALQSVLEENGESPSRRAIIKTFLPCTLAITAIFWAAAGWGAAIGALANWGAVAYAFYKYQRLGATSLTTEERREIRKRKKELRHEIIIHQQKEREHVNQTGKLLEKPSFLYETSS